MNRRISDRSLYVAKKIKAIGLLGGKCEICDNENIAQLCFHHKYDKEKQLSYLFSGRWSAIEKELQKCQLLCNNCHRELHFCNKKTKPQRIKKAILEHIDLWECEKCGYNKCYNALEFHHVTNNKESTISQRIAYITLKNVSKFIEDIERELEKCIILCSNCHKDEHFDWVFFNNNKKVIDDKLKDHKEKPKHNKDEIVKLYKQKLGYKKIMEMTGCSKATICYYCKEIN